MYTIYCTMYEYSTCTYVRVQRYTTGVHHCMRRFGMRWRPRLVKCQQKSARCLSEMAVFYTNTCKFSGCSLTFSSLGQLIEHIEETHIDSDPQFIEEQEGQQPSAVALSYVIKFVTDAAKHHNETTPTAKKRPKPNASNVASIRSITPSTGSEYDEYDEFGSESDSDNSVTTQEEYTSEVILRTMNPQIGDDKPYQCPVPGCKKRYKNVNGIKYHAKNGHRKENKVKKSYKCRCGKSYKSQQGLRQHVNIQHPPATLTPSASPKSQSQTTTTSTVQTVLTAKQLGLTLQSTGLLMEPTKCTNSGTLTTVGSTAVEPSTPLTPLTPTTPSTGFTLVTLPSHLDATVLATHKLEGTVVSVQQIQPDGSAVSIMN
ncbi:juxtaposed with another zinc finger protein 1-like [Acanthaster planci]|uniref:Juxtaposed with another zinc finger protein 1-like n=1 Tax=Acanthaster planci TaxID=133434 RepID=A0A8B7ZM90_ACAPL|nr:juxtaposed with another zinc finger protein 1-like [Acanthaster planci]